MIHGLPGSSMVEHSAVNRELTLARISFSEIATITEFSPKVAVFRTAARQLAAKFVLILKRLCDLEFPEGHFFSDRVQQKRSRQIREPC